MALPQPPSRSPEFGSAGPLVRGLADGARAPVPGGGCGRRGACSKTRLSLAPRRTHLFPRGACAGGGALTRRLRGSAPRSFLGLCGTRSFRAQPREAAWLPWETNWPACGAAPRGRWVLCVPTLCLRSTQHLSECCVPPRLSPAYQSRRHWVTCHTLPKGALPVKKTQRQRRAASGRVRNPRSRPRPYRTGAVSRARPRAAFTECFQGARFLNTEAKAFGVWASHGRNLPQE